MKSLRFLLQIQPTAGGDRTSNYFDTAEEARRVADEGWPPGANLELRPVITDTTSGEQQFRMEDGSWSTMSGGTQLD